MAAPSGSRSPSSRRAWIEITRSIPISQTEDVALLAEGVDRNWTIVQYVNNCLWSPSSRRAWIEISQ